MHRAHRTLLHAGSVVRMDTVDDAVIVHGVVAPDRREALVSYAVVEATDSALAPPLVFGGLDPHTRYRAEVVDLGAMPNVVQDAGPPWLAKGITLPGSALETTGLQMPLLSPGNAIVVLLRAQ